MERTNITAREIRLLAVLALVAGVIFDYLFNGKGIAISYPLFAVIFYCLFWVASHRQISFRTDFGWFLFIPILLLSAAFAIHSNPVLLALNFVLIPPLVLLQTTLLVYRYEWSSLRSVLRFLGRLLRQIFGNAPGVFLEVISLARVADKIEREKRKTLKNIFIGLIISAPLLVIVTTLLAEADTVFQNLIANALKRLEFIGSIPFAEHVGVIGVITVLLFGYLAVVLKAKVEGVSGPAGRDTGVWDATIVATVLVMVNVVYILFCVIQFTYLFGGEEMIRSIPDYTYAEYARQGFSELIVVTVINLSILLLGLRLTKNDGEVGSHRPCAALPACALHWNYTLFRALKIEVVRGSVWLHLCADLCSHIYGLAFYSVSAHLLQTVAEGTTFAQSLCYRGVDYLYCPELCQY